MASVQETVKFCFENYPELYQDKASVFSYLFLVGGNGFRWVDGELVDAFADEVERPSNFCTSREKAIQKYNLENIDEVMKENIEFTYSPHFTSLGGAIFSIPENAKPDWRQAATEVISAVRSSIFQMKDALKEEKYISDMNTVTKMEKALHGDNYEQALENRRKAAQLILRTLRGESAKDVMNDIERKENG